MKQKIMTFIPALILAFVLLPSAPALAAGDSVCKIVETGVEYDRFTDALADIPAGGGATIKLLEDIDYNGNITIASKTVTFNLNGKTLNLVASLGDALEVGAGGVLNLNDSGGGAFNVTSTASGKAGVHAYNGGKATVTNVTNEATVTSYGVYAESGAEVTVNGSVAAAITGDGNGAECDGVFASNGAEVTVAGDVTATITDAGDGAECCGVGAATNAGVTVGGNVAATITGAGDGAKCYGVWAENGAVVTTGSVTATITDATGDGAKCFGVSAESNAEDTEVTVTGSVSATATTEKANTRNASAWLP